MHCSIRSLHTAADIDERVNSDTESEEDEPAPSDLDEQTTKEGNEAGIVQYLFMFSFTLVVVFFAFFMVCILWYPWIQFIEKN